MGKSWYLALEKEFEKPYFVKVGYLQVGANMELGRVVDGLFEEGTSLQNYFPAWYNL